MLKLAVVRMLFDSRASSCEPPAAREASSILREDLG